MLLQITGKTDPLFNCYSFMSKDDQIDPSIYQYDEVYDEMKGNTGKQKERSRSRSRQKQRKHEDKPKKSKYIGKMKQIVTQRQKDHEYAHESKIRRENQKLGINEEMVFVTESYLKKKQQEKQAAKKKKQEQERNAKEQVQKSSYIDFKKNMLEQTYSLSKK